MKSSLPQLALSCFALCLLISGVVSAQSPPPASPPAVAASSAPVEVIPPVPTHWFSDHAGVTGPAFAVDLDRRLERFERETSNQFYVVVLPRMQSTAAPADYCRRVFNAWGMGKKRVDNGAVLFVFVQEHQLQLRVGSGLQPPLTDEVCAGVIKQMIPGFRRGEPEAGITAGVDAVVKLLQPPPPSRPAR